MHIVYIINGIWSARNATRFKNKSLSFINTLVGIKAQVICTRNNTNFNAISVMDGFILLKAFDISLHITQSHENGKFECGVIVRDNNGDLVLLFSENLVASSSFHAKCRAVIRAIQIFSDTS